MVFYCNAIYFIYSGLSFWASLFQDSVRDSQKRKKSRLEHFAKLKTGAGLNRLVTKRKLSSTGVAIICKLSYSSRQTCGIEKDTRQTCGTEKNTDIHIESRKSTKL